MIERNRLAKETEIQSLAWSYQLKIYPSLMSDLAESAESSQCPNTETPKQERV